MTALGDISRATKRMRTDGLMPPEIARRILSGDRDASKTLLMQVEGVNGDKAKVIEEIICNRMLQENGFSPSN